MRVAILPATDKTGEVKYGIKVMLTASLTSAISETPGYEAYDRINLDEVMDEQRFQRTGLVSDAEIKKIGEMTGATYVLVTEAAPMDATCIVATAKIVNVESAKIENSSVTIVSTSPRQMETDCKQLTDKLLRVGKSSNKNASSGYRSYYQESTQSHSNVINGHEWVDLGLSVKWATCNVGASKPEDYGNYYVWGETFAKSKYGWSSYRWCNGSYSTLTKYNISGTYGKVDNKTVLELSDDAARANWGGSWRMPTEAEWTELRTKCFLTWTSKNGINGCSVKGPNGNSIFLPAAGHRNGTDLLDVGSHGCYWSSSLNADDPTHAWGVTFDSSAVNRLISSRINGLSVRPITE